MIVTVIDSGVAVVGEFAESADALQNTVVIKTNHCCYKNKSKYRAILEQLSGK